MSARDVLRAAYEVVTIGVGIWLVWWHLADRAHCPPTPTPEYPAQDAAA